MPHEYSVLIHEWLSTRKQRIAEKINGLEKDGNSPNLAYYKGQMAELMVMRQYLTDRIDLDTQTYYK